jgi:hypothetical protein
VTAAVLTPFHGSQAVELGNRLWRKKVLPVGDVEYKGRLLHFTKDYLGQLVTAFQSRAYDQVPFQLADAHNTHTNDPERTRGEITAMELGDDGLYVTAALTPEGEQVLAANPKLGVSARIVEDYARSDGLHFPAAIQHVLGTLDPRIPGLGAWEAIEAASPVPDTVIDLSASVFAGDEPVDLARPWLPSKEYWASVGASHGKPPPDRGGSDEEKAANHISDAKKAASMGMHDAAAAHLARASALTSDPATQAQINTVGKGAAQIAVNHGKGAAYQLAGDTPDIFEGTDGMPDLNGLSDEQKARLAQLLELPDEQLEALAAGGVVLTAEELAALAGDPDDGQGGDDADDIAAQVAAMTDQEFAAVLAEFEAETGTPGFTPNYMPEGEPVAAGLSAEAQFAIDLATARAEETQREMSVISARLREQDYQAEKRKLADLGVPPYITELARPLLEGIGRTVELANGKTADAGQIIRKVLTEYAQQVRLLDLDVELGSPMDEPEDAGREQRDASREDIVSRYKAMTGLK